jgi:glycosyltransferase involved in cell wall biosynthesis
MSGTIMINARFLTQPLTGVQRYALELAKGLDRLIDHGVIDYERYPIVLLAPKRTRNYELNLKHISLRDVGRLGGNLWGQLELPYYARSKILWSPTNTGPISHKRHVVTIHDTSVLDHPEWFSTKYAAWHRFLLPRLAKLAMRILTVSEFSRRRLAEVVGLDPEKIGVVPAGVDPRFKPVQPKVIESVRKRLDLPRDYVLAVGNLEPRKNIAGLLKAWSLLLSHQKVSGHIHLVLTGGQASIFRDAGLSSLPDKVILTGYVRDEDLPALYSGALAFVYPSLYEGFGLPPLEAMACGVPVVASGSTSIPEVTRDAALLVDPLDIESIANGLQLVLNDDILRESLRTRGFARAKLFNWNEPAHLLWEFLVEAARREGSSGMVARDTARSHHARRG